MDRVVRGVDTRRTAGVDEGRPKPQPWLAPCVAPWCAAGGAVPGERLPAVWEDRANGIIWGFPGMGVPQNGWFIRENPTKMDDLGVPLF